MATRYPIAALTVAIMVTVAPTHAPAPDVTTPTTTLPRPLSTDADGDGWVPLSIADLLPPSPATSEVIWAAGEFLKQRCMTERGFDYDPLPSPDYTRSWMQQRDAHLMTAERARSVAYHQVPVGDPSELQSAYAELEQRTSQPAYLAALSGVPGETNQLGCSHVAREALDVGVDLSSDDFNRIIGDAEQQVFDTVAGDPGHRAALDAWVVCMATGGYTYTSPDEAFTDPRWTTNPEPSDVERTTALHDAGCREQTGLDHALREAQHRAVSSWIDANPSVVAGLRQAESELLARARSVLDE